jgi:acyl-CoA synthetase (AMP-forming)/AMP-acid ligase II
VWQGELYITGRIKDVIIIDGINYQAEDVERAAEKAAENLGAGHVVAFSAYEDDVEVLVVGIEANRSDWRAVLRTEGNDLGQSGIARMLGAIRSSVARSLGVQVRRFGVFSPSGFPRTSSGKVARGQCRSAYEASAQRSKAAANDDSLPWRLVRRS